MAKGFGNIMRQAQQMQKKMAELQEQIKDETMVGEAGQGAVKATVSLGYEVKSVEISDEIVDPEVVTGSPHLTQLFPVDVDAVVHTERGAWPTASRPVHEEDSAAIARYAAEGVLAS